MSSTYAGAITDPNGNVITVHGDGTFTDTLGVTALTIVEGNKGTIPDTLTYPVSLQADGATTAAAKIYYKEYAVVPEFQCPGITESVGIPNLIDHITLADSSTYTFTYEKSHATDYGRVTGRLASITLPNGGTISYTYQDGCPGGINGDGSPVTLKRTTSDGTKTYNHVLNGDGTSRNTTWDEAGNRTDFRFVSSQEGKWYEAERQAQAGDPGAGTGTPIYHRYTTYNSQAAGVPPTGQILHQNVLERYNEGSLSEVITDFRPDGQVAATLTKDSTIGSGTALLQSNNVFNMAGNMTSTQVTTPTGAVVSSATFGYDETALTGAPASVPSRGQAAATRGNLTSSSISTGNGTLATSTKYYDTGVPLSSTTPNGTTSYIYDATQGFVTKTTLPMPYSGATVATSAVYDASSGVQNSATGANATQITTFANYDKLLRPTLITKSASAGSTSYAYSPSSTEIQTKIDDTRSTDQKTFYDSYGRVRRTSVKNGAGVWYISDTCYDVSGRPQYRTTAYTNSADDPLDQSCVTAGKHYESYTYDALGRLTNVVRADGSSTATTYSNRAVQVSDSSGVTRINQYDLLGQITKVCEVSAGTGLVGPPAETTPQSCGTDIVANGFFTTYAHDLANHTTTITQGAQTRIFQTDAAGRTTLVSEPESGETDYSYAYLNGELQVTRTRPKANQFDASVKTTTTSLYDTLGRIRQVSYKNGTVADTLTPTKTFGYDMQGNGPNGSIAATGAAVGQMSSFITDMAGTLQHVRDFGYDDTGRLNRTVECLPDWCGQSPHDVFRWYYYDSADQLSTEQYGTYNYGGTPVSIGYDHNLAGQLTTVSGGQTDATNALTLYDVSTSSPFGPTAATFGNGLIQTIQYNNAGVLSSLTLCTGSVTSGCSGAPRYQTTRTVVGGQLVGSNDTATIRNSNFTYDEFGRLQTVRPADSGNYLNMNFSYDRYGNLWSEGISNGPYPIRNPSWNVDTGTNRLTNYTYDAAGNRLNDLAHSFMYDAEGNVVSIDNGSTATYVYDALNERVKANVGGVIERYGSDLQGRRATTWLDNSLSLKQAQYYADAQPIAYWTAADQHIHFEQQDGVGTERYRALGDGTQEGVFNDLPFGDALGGQGSDTSDNHFASLKHDLDAGSGLEHATFREYSSNDARWFSPDPFSGSYDISDPQSFNRYAYVSNGPLSGVDPEGLTPIYLGLVNGVGTYSTSVSSTSVSGFGYSLSGGSSRITAEQLIPKDSMLVYGLTHYISPAYQPPVVAPSNDQVPVHGRYTYGHFCGAGGMGTPINGTDTACQAHDACYSQAGLSPGSNFQGPNAQLQACNQNLCNAVRGARQSIINQAAARGTRNSRGISPVYLPGQESEIEADSDINFYFSFVVAPGGNACH